MDAVEVVADLFSAYSSGDIDRVVSLIDAGASPFTSNDEGNTLFHLCCTNNTDGPRILERLFTVLASASARVLYISNNDGNTPLHLACINGVIGCVQSLLSRSPAIINIFELTNNAGLSPLYYASKAGHIDIVTLAVSWYGLLSTDNIIKCIDDAVSWQIIRLLLMKITLRDMMDTCNKHEHTQHLLRLFPMHNEYFQLSDGITTVLHLSATSGDLEYFTTIVSLAFDINRLDSDSYTPLHRAIEYGCVSIAKYLISQPNCLCETLTKDNLTPLHDAVGDPSRLSLVQGLVERDVDVNIRDCNGATALHYSCRWGHLSIVEYLTSLPYINYTRDSWGRTSIHFAAEFGHVNTVKYLVESCNHDINVEDKYGNTPLYMACFYNHLPVVEYLTGQPNCNINSNNERHPLLAATDKEHLEIVKYLIESTDCDINVREEGTGSTPLHKACYNGSLSIVEYLRSKPQCDIKAIDNKLNQPLHYAACQGHKEIVSILGKKVSEDSLYKCMESAKQLAEPDIMKLSKNHYEDRILLINACASGNVDILRHLVIDKHCDVNAKERWSGYTPLHYACENGHFEIVKILTNHPQCNIEAENNFNDRPLHKAYKSGNVDIVRHLVIDKHCDVNAKWGLRRYTPLHYACEKGQFEIVKILTNHPQCNIEAEDNSNCRPLHKACESGNVDIVRHLVIDKHCDVNVKERNGYTPLHYACKKGHFEIVKILTNHPQCNIEAEDNSNDRPLHKACESGNVDIVRHLVIDKHCDVNAKWGLRGYTPLHYACEKGQFEIVKILTNHPQCNIEAEDNSNCRPLHKACESGNVDIVRHLVIDKHCDVNVKERNGYTPLHYACENGHFEIVKILTNHPQCNIEAEDNSNDRPLHKACESGNVDIVRHLVIDKHCDVNAKWGLRGYTPLHYACEKGQFEIVKILTNHPQCNIEAEDNSNCRPLHKACESGNVDIVRHLVIDKHCDVNVKERNGYTPLHYACENGHFEIVKILTNHPQCNIEAEDNSNDRPLHKACESGNVDIVHHLVIDKHCDVNAKWGLRGYTPLHYACEKGQFEIVKILTNHPQCNIEAEDNSNNRPLHKACESGNVDIVRHLVTDKHCDVNAIGGWNGYTPLHHACEKGHFEIVKFLTDHPQCNIEAESKYKSRPLQVVFINRFPARNIVNYLVEVKGCNTQGITTYNRRTQNYLDIHQSSGIALLRVVKCILTGPPGAGKSTLKKRLLNQSLDTGPSLSTGVIDAAVQVNSFRKLSQHNAVVTTEWKEQELDEEAVLISKKLLPTSKASNKSTRPTTPLETSVESAGTPQPTSVNETVGLTSSFENKQESPEGIDLYPNTNQQGNTNVSTSSPVYMEAATDTVVIDESLIMEHENVPNSPKKIVNCEEEESNKVQNSNSLVNDCVKGLSDYVMKIPVKKRQEYEEKFEEAKDDNHTMLHIIDTGGQPEFHEILPALITGPAINLLVFKLTEDLRSRYEIVYRTSAGDSKPYETSLTHEEVIFRSLASIACLRQNTIGWSFDEIPIEDNSEPVAFLIATHRDQVDENKVSEVNEQLRTKIENSSHLFDFDLIQFSQSEQVIFPLDTTKDEKEVDHLRSFLHKVISKKFQELKIPASWCTLSLKLRKHKTKLFKYDTCLKLAKECGIKDKKEFKNVLWYLHHRVGIIMHYPNVAGLEDIIITDLQLVFDRITNLITKCFTFEQSGSAAVEREFRKNGRFSESQLDEMSSREKRDPLNTKRLVALLKHLYIVAGPMKDKVGQKTVNYYFMPCALKPAKVEREERDGSVSPAPLLICFECGYTPVGVFCCLVVYLLDQKTDQVLEWELTGNVQYRNRITFQVGKYHDIVTLISHATYLEIWVQQIKGSKLSKSDLCDKILSSLHKGLVTVTQSLHYTYKSEHMFGVPCTCTAVPHPAVIDSNEETTTCANGKMVELNEKQLYWSSKVRLSHCRPIKINVPIHRLLS